MTKLAKFILGFILIVFIVTAILSIAGCGKFSREVAKLTGYSRECVDGVEYLQFPSGVTVAYNPDGSIKQCKRKN